jgi:uncharacterized OB-fold protein
LSPGLDTTPSQPASFAGSITLPYTLTAGRAASVFVAELANQRIVGSRAPGSERIMVPAQDVDARTGEDASELLEMPSTGALSAFTETDRGVLALIRIDGAGTDMAHQVLDARFDELRIGQRVRARWATEASRTMLDLEGFVLSDDGVGAEPKILESSAEPVLEQPYRLELTYRHAYGPYYGRLFDELSTSRRILGSRCPSCHNVLVPPRAFCEVCFVRTDEWVDVADTGVLQAFSIIHLAFVGQTREPPYVYAEIVLDGSATRLIHTIGEITPEDATARLLPGETRVKAVWRDGEPTGTLTDIDYFKVIEK